MKKRIYIEIGNICNLACSFCPGTTRAPHQMSVSEFRRVMDEVTPIASEIYLHMMGEPLLHPLLDTFLSIAEGYDIPICITTNGTLLSECANILLSHAKILKKVSISLQSYEANQQKDTLEDYLSQCVAFGKRASEAGIYVVYRLWNFDSDTRAGENLKNNRILSFLHMAYRDEWQTRYSGFRLMKNTFLECAEIFEWPSESISEPQESGRCYGLISQIAILADGTVCPCCLDCEGEIQLGNLFTTSLCEILNGERAKKMYKSLCEMHFTEPLCQKCTYARRFQIK